MFDHEARRAFVEQLHLEHVCLRRTLNDIAEMLDAWGDNPQTGGAAVRARLVSLREQIERHFAREDLGGVLEEAAACCPELGPRATSTVNEHVELLIELARLIAATELETATPELMTVESLRRQFVTFARQLQHHEATENQILRQAFGADASALELEDCELLPPTDCHAAPPSVGPR